jgi:NADPH2:quinone reductase
VILQVKKGHKIFVHAAAGGVGSLLVQWGRSLGATVIAAVSNEEKAVQAKEDGADHVIMYSQENFVDRVKEITEGAGVEVVYDAVGKDTLKVSFPTTTCFHLASSTNLSLFGVIRTFQQIVHLSG